MIRGVPSDLLISCAVFNIFLSFQVYVAPSVGTEQSRLRTTLEAPLVLWPGRAWISGILLASHNSVGIR